MSLARVRAALGWPGFPRVSGDEPVFVGDPPANPGFSPRERG